MSPFLKILALVVASLVNVSYAHLECLTAEPDADRAEAFSKAVRQYQIKRNGGGARNRRSLDEQDEPARRLRQTVFSATVPTVYHIILEDSMEQVDITDALIQEQHDVLNESFASSGFHFDLIGITRTTIPVAGWFPFSTEEEELRASLHQGDFETLNVFVVPLDPGFGGYASLPTIVLLENSEQDGVVINHSVLPGGTWPPGNLGMIMVHETGHWLDLYHTFAGGCDGEFGDFIADTPAMDLSQGAFDCPTEPRDTCPGKPGLDPIDNFMSYSSDICYATFTPMQAVRMQATWDILRTGTKAPACTKLCQLLIPENFPNLGQCRKAMCVDGNVKGDTCSKANKIKLGRSVSGSTVFATPGDAPTCRGIDTVSGGVWYKYSGKGELLRASTCGFNSVNMDTQISVYKGSCGDLTCVTANDDSDTCTDNRSEVSFIAQQGTDYFILVHGRAFNAEFTSEGAYDFVVDEIPRQGGCFETTERPGCELLDCEETICNSNPFCCDVGWDFSCASAACDECDAPNPLPILCEVCDAGTGNLIIDITADNYPSETSWEVTVVNKGGFVIAQGGPYEPDFPPEPIQISETVADLCLSDCYEFTIFDAFGDGICCEVGSGTYSITFEGETFVSPSSGAFGDTETISFGNCA